MLYVRAMTELRIVKEKREKRLGFLFLVSESKHIVVKLF